MQITGLLEVAELLPTHLTPRSTAHSTLILILFTGCILLTALARRREQYVFLYLIQAVFLLKPLEDLEKESYRISSGASRLFLVQFFFITAGAVYWVFKVSIPFDNLIQSLIPLFVPTIYFLYQYFMVNTAAGIMGNRQVTYEFNYFVQLLTQFFGVVFFIEFFISYFQPGLIFESSFVMLTTYIVYLIVRFVRGFWIVYKNGVPWYYIILYFWTLEILPLLIVAKLFYKRELEYLLSWIIN